MSGIVTRKRGRCILSLPPLSALLPFVSILLLATLGWAEEKPHPLEAPDTSSPRATLKSFTTACDDIFRLIREEGNKIRGTQAAAPIVRRIFRCMDLSEIPVAFRDDMAAESAVCLKEVLDRIELPPESQIPLADDLEPSSADGIRQWRIPPTEITIAEVKEGPRRGEFLFTPSTVDRAKEFYRRVEALPYKPGATKGFYDWFLSEPGWMIPTSWIHALPEWTRVIVFGNTVWSWVGMMLSLSLGALVMLVAYRIGRQRAVEKRRASAFRYVFTLAWPVAAMLVPVLLKFFIARQLTITGTVLSVVTISLDVVFLIAVVVVLVGMANRIAELIISSPRIHPRGVDAQLIRLGARSLSIVAAAFVLIDGGQRLGIPLTTLLAGAGVGGLTIALAAQDTLKNFFGSMMIILDRPYRVGERIIVKRYDGVVEEIGLRSTKIRLLTGHQAAIPNEEMARSDVENVGRRPHIRRIEDIAVPFDTPPEKIQKALDIVRSLLDNHEGMKPEFPPRVFFNAFNRDSVNLRIIYWFHPPNYWDFLAFSERLNLQIMKGFGAEGIEFALPSTTTRFAPGRGKPPVPYRTNDARQPERQPPDAGPGEGPAPLD